MLLEKWHQYTCLMQGCHESSICKKCNIWEDNKIKQNKTRYTCIEDYDSSQMQSFVIHWGCNKLKWQVFPSFYWGLLSPNSTYPLVIEKVIFWWNASNSLYQTWIKSEIFSADANILLSNKPISYLHWTCVLIGSQREVKSLHKIQLQTVLNAMKCISILFPYRLLQSIE